MILSRGLCARRYLSPCSRRATCPICSVCWATYKIDPIGSGSGRPSGRPFLWSGRVGSGRGRPPAAGRRPGAAAPGRRIVYQVNGRRRPPAAGAPHMRLAASMHFIPPYVAITANTVISANSTRLCVEAFSNQCTSTIQNNCETISTALGNATNAPIKQSHTRIFPSQIVHAT